MRFYGLCLPVFAAALACAASIPPGDSQRGEHLFRTEGCVQCHSINGQGGRIAPDLGRLVDRNFTPSLLASTMWNHAPSMWAAMLNQRIVKSTLSPESAADLFAYFYSTRFFDKPGDAARGKALFTSKHCAECHGITNSNFAGAKPVAQWTSLENPIVLAQYMWNHAAAMRGAFAQKGVAWPELTSQDLSDVLVYLRNLPETRGRAPRFSYVPAVAGGEAVFEAKGCAKCHNLQQNWRDRLKNTTLTGVAADMWDHAPRMAGVVPTLTEDEMRKVVSYIWALQFFQGEGNATRGKRVFTAKGCASCHNDASSGAPSLAHKGPFSDISIVSVLWEHGPRMLERMRQRNIAWPRFEGAEMSDLIAYLNTL